MGGAGLARERAHAGVGLSQDVAGAGARSLEEQIGLGGVELDQGAGDVVRRDFGVAVRLRRALGKGERLGHLGGGLQIHTDGTPSRWSVRLRISSLWFQHPQS